MQAGDRKSYQTLVWGSLVLTKWKFFDMSDLHCVICQKNHKQDNWSSNNLQDQDQLSGQEKIFSISPRLLSRILKLRTLSWIIPKSFISLTFIVPPKCPFIKQKVVHYRLFLSVASLKGAAFLLIQAKFCMSKPRPLFTRNSLFASLSIGKIFLLKQQEASFHLVTLPAREGI